MDDGELSKYGGTEYIRTYGSTGGTVLAVRYGSTEYRAREVLYQVPTQLVRPCIYMPNKYRRPRTARQSAHDGFPLAVDTVGLGPMSMPSAAPPTAPPATSLVRVLCGGGFSPAASMWQHDRAGLDRSGLCKSARYPIAVCPDPSWGFQRTRTSSSPCSCV